MKVKKRDQTKEATPKDGKSWKQANGTRPKNAKQQTTKTTRQEIRQTEQQQHNSKMEQK